MRGVVRRLNKISQETWSKLGPGGCQRTAHWMQLPGDKEQKSRLDGEGECQTCCKPFSLEVFKDRGTPNRYCKKNERDTTSGD